MSFLLRIDGLPTEDISPVGWRYIIGREEIYDPNGRYTLRAILHKIPSC